MRTLTDVFTPGAPTLTEGLRTLVVSPERELEPGITVRATFTFRNQGGAPATGVRVRFNVPEGLVYLVGSGQLDGTPLDDEHGNSPLLARAGADIGDVAPGAERRIELAYSVAGAIENGSTVELQAAVAAFELAPVGSNIVRLVARSRPALENNLTTVAIEARSAEPRPGTEATVTVRVHNAGESSAHDVVVVAPVPEHTTYVPNSARVNGRELERDLLGPFDRVHAPVISHTLPASATVTLQYRVRIDDPLPNDTIVVARAQIASQELTGFSIEPAAITVRAQADFEGERTALKVEPSENVSPGSRVQVRLTAYNAGTTAAENVTLNVVFPDGMHPARGSARLDGHPLRDQRDRKKDTQTYEFGTIAAREAVEFTLDALVASPVADLTQLPVAATLRWDAGDRELTDTITVRSQPFISPRRNRIERANGIVVQPSDECEATIVITNDGSAAATDAVLHLRLDAGMDDVRVFDKQTRLDLENHALELGDIEPYSSRKLTVRGRVRTPYADRAEVRLGASLHAQELGEVALGEAVWRVDSHPAFSAETSTLQLVQDDVFRPNQLVDVFVRVRNEGTDIAHNVRLLLYVSPEARLESVEGATRERNSLLFGEIPPGASAEARLGVRLLRSLAKAHPVTLESVLTADAMLPVQLSKLAIVTTAEPNFAIGTLRSEPDEIADAGEELEFVLHMRNGGDGPARKVGISIGKIDSLIYVPNSTTVNDLPVRDVGAQSPLMGERGIVLSDVDPGVEATIRWREVVHNGLPSGETITRVARISYDGDRVDEITARELKVRCAPAFANTISGLPFGLDGMIGPAFAGGGQRAIGGTDFLELPPATPVARNEVAPSNGVLSLTSGTNGHNGHNGSNGHRHDVETKVFHEVAAFDPERLGRALRFLSEARFTGLITHLFALRAFLPDAIPGANGAALNEVRETLRESLDRIFIRLRMPNYVIAPRDLESPTGKAALEDLLESLDAEEPAETAAGRWAAMARLIPTDGDALTHYRELLVEALDELAPADDVAFIDALQRKPYPVLDAALDVVRAQLAVRA